MGVYDSRWSVSRKTKPNSAEEVEVAQKPMSLIRALASPAQGPDVVEDDLPADLVSAMILLGLVPSISQTFFLTLCTAQAPPELAATPSGVQSIGLDRLLNSGSEFSAIGFRACRLHASGGTSSNTRSSKLQFESGAD